jgi:hypothetical protein
MDLLAQERMLFSLMLILLSVWPGRSFAEGIFASRIEYFTAVTAKAAAADSFTADDLWSEVHQRPDGVFEVYRPPAVVTRFLQDPTPENARAYVRWNSVKMQKILQAQRVLEQPDVDPGQSEKGGL